MGSGREERSLDKILEQLQASGLVVGVGQLYRLTDEGTAVAKQYAGETFGKWLTAAEKSLAYRAFCQKVYGASRFQFNMATERQLNKLIEVLRLCRRDRVLDLGCGVGAISEHLADATGARLLGVDFAAAAIKAARKRNHGKSAHPSFRVMDMDTLRLPAGAFDAIIAVDTLYFVRDLRSVIASTKRCLKSGGRMGILYTTHISPEEPKKRLEPRNTPLAGALRSCGLDFQTWDFTDDERGVWERQLQAAEELKASFKAEGNLLTYQQRVGEANHWLEFCRTGRSSRYLYCADP